MTEWRPAAGQSARRARAELLRYLRAFFIDRDVLEVETPLLARHPAADPHIRQFRVDGHFTGFLRSSPEYPLKRLLAAGEGDIYQLGRVFRDEESGPRHNPEFTLLEWYRLKFDDQALAAEVLALIEGAVQVVDGARRPVGVRWIRYAELREAAIEFFAPGTDADECAIAERDVIRPGVSRVECALLACGADPDWPESAREDWLMARATERLPDDTLTVMTHFPAAQAVLARVDPVDPRWARRFEIFWGSLELANGYWELGDPAELRRRFDEEMSRRTSAGGGAELPFDPTLAQALESGLPECAGVALGVDRLLMALLGAETIAEVMDFPLDRA
ncbi:MAG: EF-P lysine aminoacylase EpmA [Thioalkalivibrionaceae bacterium]